MSYVSYAKKELILNNIFTLLIGSLLILTFLFPVCIYKYGESTSLNALNGFQMLIPRMEDFIFPTQLIISIFYWAALVGGDILYIFVINSFIRDHEISIGLTMGVNILTPVCAAFYAVGGFIALGAGRYPFDVVNTLAYIPFIICIGLIIIKQLIKSWL